MRDGLFDGRSVGKKLIGLRAVFSEDHGQRVTYRESILRNASLALAYILFLIPYAGWILGPLAFGAECLTTIGDKAGMRIGDMLARTFVVQATTPVGNGAGTMQEQRKEQSAASDAGPNTAQDV